MASVVVPGIWRLEGTRGSNVYLVEAADGQLVLIDTGFAPSLDAIEAELAATVPGRHLSMVLLTHSHPDHSGAAEGLREHLGVPVVIGSGDAKQDSEGWRVSMTSKRGPMSWLMRRMMRRRMPPLPRIDRVLDGEFEVVPGLLAIPTPGHTPGSYCFLDTARDVAFVGDLVISHNDGLARSLKFINSDDRQYLETMRIFGERAPSIGCCGHGEPVLANFGEQLRTLAALPRRSGTSPAVLLWRVRRLLRFARGLRNEQRG
ncbi:MAG: MBL fold metallo-hydrolase [Chloroflexi bacterium]|nr:MAG: MBL fold metallo-hydrolase [Chloroflexota bacterium]